MSKKTGGPAFPVETKLNPISDEADDYQTRDNHITQFAGMTLRDYFAAKAMVAIISNPRICDKIMPKKIQDAVSEVSYEVADAMLEARNK